MKRFSVNIAIHIVGIVLLSAGVFWLALHELWFSVLITTALLIGVGIHLYSMQFKQLILIRKLTESIRFNDMTRTFQPPFKNKIMEEVSNELSEALKTLRERLWAEEVKHQYYENLLNKVDTAVFVADKFGHIEWMNHAATTHWGIINNQLPQQIMSVSSDETQIIRFDRDGNTFEMAASCTIFTVKGKEQYLISLKNIHSVLERNEMEAWQKLIRVLTHEIMNSITPIISLSETLSEREIPNQPDRKEYAVILQAMQVIHRRSKGLLEFVENYRRLTRIPSPVHMEVWVDDIFGDLKKLFSDIDIVFECSTKESILWIDRTQIEQVLINLIKNAIDACSKKENKRIVVCLSIINGYQRLSVSDNGEGILPEVVDKVFVPFFTTKSSGSGIGLSLCKQIMNLHGGTISVHSEIGKGSCFTLTFPVKRMG